VGAAVVESERYTSDLLVEAWHTSSSMVAASPVGKAAWPTLPLVKGSASWELVEATALSSMEGTGGMAGPAGVDDVLPSMNVC
jgi:hypothetical protein